MRNFKKILTIALAAMMLMAAMAVCVSAAGTKFTDVSENDEVLYKAVSLLEGMGITKGVSEDTFGTNEDVTREQMAAFVYRLMKAGKSLEGGENNTTFEDLYDDTFYGMISWASNQGIIKGVSETQFNPDGGITLQDAYTMLVRALGYEKEAVLNYPYDYIDIAEEKGVTLGKGLPSKVGYTTELTRGNVAILLYNAFFADMGEKEVVEKAVEIGKGDNSKWVLQKIEESPKVCEKIYKIKQVDYIVRGTTHYAFNDSASSNEYKPTEDINGENTMFLVVSEADKDNPDIDVKEMYATVEELGLSGTADNYIMSELTVYFTYDSKKEVVDEIFFAESKMEKLTANSATYGSNSADKKVGDTENFYQANSGGFYPRMDGSLVVSGKTLYFYDAPYEYSSPSYSGATTEEERYALRNVDSTKLIDLKCLNESKGLYTYYITDDEFVSKDANSTMLKTFNSVRTKGVYTMDIYDYDGDGRYEYMWYKPASFAKIVMDDKHEFSDYKEVVDEPSTSNALNALSVVPTLYANGATITGTAFNDEDYVIAYVNGDANYIHIFNVAQGKKGTITGIDVKNANIKLGTQSYRSCYQFLYVKDFFAKDNDTRYDVGSGSADTAVMKSTLLQTANIGREVIFYNFTHNGLNNIMYYEFVDSVKSSYAGESILIPLEAETSAERNAKFEYDQYLKVLLDGEETYILVDVDNCYPKPKKTSKGSYLFDNVIESDENGKRYDVYLNKLCTYTVDKDGYYTIKSLLHAKDEDGDFDHIPLVYDSDVFHSEKKVNQAGNDLGYKNSDEKVYLKKLSGRYSVLDLDDVTMLGTYGDETGSDHFYRDAYVDSKTVFIIRTKTEEKGKIKNEITTYTGLSFPGTTSIDTPLTNVQYIYENYGDSTSRVNLVLFYGEVDGELEFESGISKTGYRVVKSATPVKVADEEFRFSYDLLNLSTGEVETGILGTINSQKASGLTTGFIPAGSIIELDKNGKVNDKAFDIATNKTINVDTNYNLVKFLDIVPKDRTFEIELIRGDSNEFESEDYGTPLNMFAYDDKTAITVLKFGKKNDFDTVEFAKLDASEISNDNENILCYNSKYFDEEDPESEVSLEYAEYVKAYIIFDNDVKDEELPVIENIVVIVNDGEEVELLDIKEK